MYLISNRLSSRGLTLIELMLTLVLVFALAAAIWMSYQTGFDIFYDQHTRTGGKGEVGRGLVRMAEELRHATSLTSAEQTAFTFTADTDDNGVDESIQYTWSGVVGEALRRIDASTTPLVNSVSSLAFSYYDASNNLLSFPVTASLVKVVSFDLTVTSGDEVFQLRSRARLRNL